MFCGRQNIALHDHRDSATDLERDVLGTVNQGNFLALLSFRVEAGDVALGEHLSSASHNATCTSNTIQNQIVHVLADEVRGERVKKVKVARWFSVISDEVIDVSNMKQLTIVLRYVDGDSLGLIREDLIAFVECNTGISGR